MLYLQASIHLLRSFWFHFLTTFGLFIFITEIFRLSDIGNQIQAALSTTSFVLAIFLAFLQSMLKIDSTASRVASKEKTKLFSLAGKVEQCIRIPLQRTFEDLGLRPYYPEPSIKHDGIKIRY